MKTATNKCKACGKRYKLPQEPDERRKLYCHTCEFIHDYIQTMWDVIEKRYKVDGLAVWEAVREIDLQANLLKEINGDSSNT